RLGIDATSPADLVQAIGSAASADTPILAGPLNSITVHLVDLPNPIVGLSWGFDLHQMNNPAWLSRLSGIIVDSEPTAAIAREAGVNPDRITFIPWGVDLNAFHPNGPKQDLQAWGVPSDARVLLTLRAHEPQYRVSDVIRAMPHIVADTPNAFLLLGNKGPQTSELEQLVSDLQLKEHISFIPLIAEAELPHLLRAADVYISASEVDGTSVTLLQAMACGIRVVVSDIPGNRPWVEQGVSGRLFPLAKPEKLADAVQLALVQSPTLTQEARGRVAQHADWSQNQERLSAAMRAAAAT
ncbi:glycosyltransferase family 4 protein, partial [Candidatus Nanopelagicales bacterium]|nr:glycosyltransferase family 4 protein [Candidatus Nanopelagicales bacterium]